MTSRRHVLTLLGGAALAGCSAPALVTRRETDPFEGGIGGTGIVGIVTGFGSILVNGLTVEVTSRTRFRSALEPLALEDLAPGHSVTIAAEAGANGMIARSVTRDLLLVGTLHQSGNAMSVNTVRVHAEPGSLGQASPGQRVAVSGVWAPTGVIASRIEPVADGPDLVAGTANVSRSQLSIGQASIATPEPLAGLNGGYLTVFGAMAHGVFEADRLKPGRFDGSVSLRQISAEGFLEPSADAPGFRIAGLGHSFARTTRLAAIAANRALYFGPYDGLFGARRGYVVPTDFGQRQSLLNPGIKQGFTGDVIGL